MAIKEIHPRSLRLIFISTQLGKRTPRLIQKEASTKRCRNSTVNLVASRKRRTDCLSIFGDGGKENFYQI